MNIRSKLAWMLTVILVITVTAGSGYALFYIRAYMLEQAAADMEKDGHWMMHTLQFLPDSAELDDKLRRLGDATDYEIALFDSSGAIIAAWPDGTQRSPHLHFHPNDLIDLIQKENQLWVIDDPEDDKIRVYASIRTNDNQSRFFVINRSRSEILQPIAEIRRIIYIGLGASLLFILIFSIILAHYMARPLLSLTQDVERIAKGDTRHFIPLKRNDEIGKLVSSVNKMAQKLRSDYEHLQYLNEKQKHFFSDITHEVRNPLHTIMGSLEMLELPNLNDENRRKYVKNVRSQTERIGRLFKDLMTLQRFDSDENFVIRNHINLAEIVKNVSDWYQQIARAKGLQMNVDNHPCLVYADPGKLEQVLDNLISNAIKFTNSGSISLTYTNSGNMVEISVKDTGIGIPEAHWPRLFDRFYRTDKARSRDKGGTGLGLSVVKGILKAHGSDIHVESDVGKGSRFYFYLATSGNAHPLNENKTGKEKTTVSTR